MNPLIMEFFRNCTKHFIRFAAVHLKRAKSGLFDAEFSCESCALGFELTFTEEVAQIYTTVKMRKYLQRRKSCNVAILQNLQRRKSDNVAILQNLQRRKSCNVAILHNL